MTAMRSGPAMAAAAAIAGKLKDVRELLPEMQAGGPGPEFNGWHRVTTWNPPEFPWFIMVDHHESPGALTGP